MKAVKVAFLWHNHQPDYEINGEYILPWVRLHAVKDYYDIPSLLSNYPSVKQNFNFVPVLIDQINKSISGEVVDRVFKLTEIEADKLSISQKEEILASFFTCNYDNQIKRFTRFLELFNQKENAINNWTKQDWIDLQVWYNLSWVGEISKKRKNIKYLLKKERNFIEDDKQLILSEHIEIMKLIVPKFKELIKKGQISFSFTPYYHPILPLLYHSRKALESTPGLDLKDLSYDFHMDAKEQLDRSKRFYTESYDQEIKGFWPSEGSLSNEILNLMIEMGISWTATDEMMLLKSGKKLHPLDKYFVHDYKGKKGDIKIFFRDTDLSDRIGFKYAGWEAGTAVNDFLNSILIIRSNLIDTYGEDILDQSCISIILDGENCWEFYSENGIHFLKELFMSLEKNSLIKTICMDDESDKRAYRKLNKINAGSWIGGDFKIWLSEEIHKKAWQLLQYARDLFERNKSKISNDLQEEVYTYILKAESSDWFWWYYSGHHAPNKLDFDTLFRYNLQMVYVLLGYEVPEVLKHSLWSKKQIEEMRKHSNFPASTMHQVSF